MKWILFDFITGETKGEFPLSEDQVSIDVNNTDTGTLVIPAYFLSEAERNNFSNENFKPYSRGVVLAKDDEDWDSPTALLTAGVITKWSYSLSSESYTITFESPYQYLLKIGPYSSALWNEEEDPGAEISFEADTWGGLMWKILQYSLLGDDITSPPAGFNTPQIFVSDATTIGTGMGWVEYASQMNSVASIWEQIRDGEESKGEEFRFIPKWTDSDQDTVQIKVEFGTGLAPHINFNTGDPYVLDPQNTEAEWEVSELTLDNDYTFIANKWVVSGEVIKQDNSFASTDYPALVEFEALGDTVLEASVDARLVERMKNNEKPAVVGSLTVVGDHDFETLSLLGRFIQIQATQKSIGVYASLRVISASWTSVDGQNVITYELMQPQARYSKLISKLVQTGDANNDPTFVFGGFDFPEIEVPTTPTIPDIPPYTPPVPPVPPPMPAEPGTVGWSSVGVNLPYWDRSGGGGLSYQTVHEKTLTVVKIIPPSVPGTSFTNPSSTALLISTSGKYKEEIDNSGRRRVVSDPDVNLSTSYTISQAELRDLFLEGGDPAIWETQTYRPVENGGNFITTYTTFSSPWVKLFSAGGDYVYAIISSTMNGPFKTGVSFTKHISIMLALKIEADGEISSVTPLPRAGKGLLPEFQHMKEALIHQTSLNHNQVFFLAPGYAFNRQVGEQDRVGVAWAAPYADLNTNAQRRLLSYDFNFSSPYSVPMGTVSQYNNADRFLRGFKADFSDPLNPVYSDAVLPEGLDRARSIQRSSPQPISTTGLNNLVQPMQVVSPVGNAYIQMDNMGNIFMLKNASSTQLQIFNSIAGSSVDEETYKTLEDTFFINRAVKWKKTGAGWQEPEVISSHLVEDVLGYLGSSWLPWRISPVTGIPEEWEEDYFYSDDTVPSVGLSGNFLFGFRVATGDSPVGLLEIGKDDTGETSNLATLPSNIAPYRYLTTNNNQPISRLSQGIANYSPAIWNTFNSDAWAYMPHGWSRAAAVGQPFFLPTRNLLVVPEEPSFQGGATYDGLIQFYEPYNLPQLEEIDKAIGGAVFATVENELLIMGNDLYNYELNNTYLASNPIVQPVDPETNRFFWEDAQTGNHGANANSNAGVGLYEGDIYVWGEIIDPVTGISAPVPDPIMVSDGTTKFKQVRIRPNSGSVPSQVFLSLDVDDHLWVWGYKAREVGHALAALDYSIPQMVPSEAKIISIEALASVQRSSNWQGQTPAPLLGKLGEFYSLERAGMNDISGGQAFSDVAMYVATNRIPQAAGINRAGTALLTKKATAEVGGNNSWAGEWTEVSSALTDYQAVRSLRSTWLLVAENRIYAWDGVETITLQQTFEEGEFFVSISDGIFRASQGQMGYIIRTNKSFYYVSADFLAILWRGVNTWRWDSTQPGVDEMFKKDEYNATIKMVDIFRPQAVKELRSD